MVRSVIEKERPDSILVSMGGQTALNVGIDCSPDYVICSLAVFLRRQNFDLS
jgi:carbamoylphosphate synthase large subunit